MVKTNKKTLLVSLLIVLFSAIFLIGGLSFNANPQVNNQVKAATSATLDLYWVDAINYSVVNLLVTTDDSKKPQTYIEAPDVSEEQNGLIKAYIVAGENNTYDCVIHGDVDKIYAPDQSSYMFKRDSINKKLIYLKSIIFENFDTSNVRNFMTMFGGDTFDMMVCEFGGGNLDIESPTVYTDLYKAIFGSDFVSQDGNNANDEQEAKKFIANLYKQETGYDLFDNTLEYLDISCFTISSTATIDYFITDSIDTIIAPAECNQTINLPYSMYFENTDTKVTELSSATNGKILTNKEFTKAPIQNNNNGSTPDTGFNNFDIVLTTVLGITLLTVLAVAFVGTKKRYNKR